MTATLCGGCPTAWQLADARAACGFTRTRTPIGRDRRGERFRTIDLCGQCDWWIEVSGDAAAASAHTIWRLIYEHACDHVLGIEPVAAQTSPVGRERPADVEQGVEPLTPSAT